MSIVHKLAWMAVRKVAGNPRVQAKAIDAVRAVDKGMEKVAEKTVDAVTTATTDSPAKTAIKKADDTMTRAADKVAEIASSKDPAREVGRALGKFFSDK